MSRKPTLLRKALSVVLMLSVGGFYTMSATSVLAQTAAKSSGELSVVGSATINGTAAISGATVFSESRVKTAPNGAATINLGKLGRIQLGADTEMTLRFSDGSIGGNLSSGRAVVSAPAGVAVNVATTDGVATSDGKDAAVLTVDVSCGNTRVASSRSAAKVNAGGKTEYVAAGQEVAVGAQTAGAARCQRLLTDSQSNNLSTGAIAALIIAGIGGAVAGIIAAAQADNVTPTSIVVSGFRP
ncbi:MAG: hypothetical protein KF868_06160 [Acidobacteria bacterium]|nr:hypothetical protein [Acidobacteriota bacterium]